MPPFPTPHLDKLEKVLAENDKLPPEDKSRLEAAKERYFRWVRDLDSVEGTPDVRLGEFVRLLNEYRRYVDLDLIFDSPKDFLYRQKGQLKLDNSVLEEFLPRLITADLIPELLSLPVEVGPRKTFSAAYFSSGLESLQPGGGLELRHKAQDFAIALPLHLKASHRADFTESVARTTYLAYVAAECKTNLDKTMFQEACATARDVKAAVTGSRYFILCEWLDMTPLSTVATDIDEVLILRGKRLSSGVRKDFDTYAKRQRARSVYAEFLEKNPARAAVFERFIAHIRGLLSLDVPGEEDAVARGYF